MTDTTAPSPITRTGHHNDPYIIADPLTITGLDIFPRLQGRNPLRDISTSFRFAVPAGRGGEWRIAVQATPDRVICALYGRTYHASYPPGGNRLPQDYSRRSDLAITFPGAVGAEVRFYINFGSEQDIARLTGMTLTLFPPPSTLGQSPVPVVPTGFRHSAPFLNRLKFQWTSVADADAYEVRFAATPADLAAAPILITSYHNFTVRFLERGASRSLQVRSISAGGASAWSALATGQVPPNRAPVAQPAVIKARVGGRVVSGQLEATDADGWIDDRYLTFALEIPPRNRFGHPVAGLTIATDGSWSFDPGNQFRALTASETETVTFVYRVSDGHGGSTTAGGTITIRGRPVRPSPPPPLSGRVQENADMLAALLPEGPVWAGFRTNGTHARALIEARAVGLARIEDRADVLLVEVNPLGSRDMLAAREREAGLPGSCVVADPTDAERRQALVNQWRGRGGQSPAYFIGVAARLGYTIHITEFRPFRCGYSVCGGTHRCGEARMRHDWRVAVPGPRINHFHCGQSRCGQDPLGFVRRAEDIECVLHHIKPAHSRLAFRYQGVN